MTIDGNAAGRRALKAPAVNCAGQPLRPLQPACLIAKTRNVFAKNFSISVRIAAAKPQKIYHAYQICFDEILRLPKHDYKSNTIP